MEELELYQLTVTSFTDIHNLHKWNFSAEKRDSQFPDLTIIMSDSENYQKLSQSIQNQS